MHVLHLKHAYETLLYAEKKYATCTDDMLTFSSKTFQRTFSLHGGVVNEPK